MEMTSFVHTWIKDAAYRSYYHGPTILATVHIIMDARVAVIIDNHFCSRVHACTRIWMDDPAHSASGHQSDTRATQVRARSQEVLALACARASMRAGANSCTCACQCLWRTCSSMASSPNTAPSWMMSFDSCVRPRVCACIDRCGRQSLLSCARIGVTQEVDTSVPLVHGGAKRAVFACAWDLLLIEDLDVSSDEDIPAPRPTLHMTNLPHRQASVHTHGIART